MMVGSARVALNITIPAVETAIVDTTANKHFVERMNVDPEQPEVIADEHGLIPEPRVPVQHDGHGVLTEVPQIPDDSNH